MSGGQSLGFNKYNKCKKPEDSHAEGRQDRAEDFSPVLVGFGKRPPQPYDQQNRSKPEQQQIGPRKIARNRKLHKEEKEAQESDHTNQEPGEDQPVEFSAVHERHPLN